MLKKILLSLAALVLLVAVGSQFLPSHWSVSRSIVINAPPSRIIPLLSDLKNGWPQWSAFDNDDPTLAYSYPNPKPGVGSERAWQSKKMGSGVQKITRADAKGVAFVLNMPDYKMSLDGEFAFEAEGKATKVTWTDRGVAGRSPLQRVMVQFMDKMMGGTFEESLAKLKVVVESGGSRAAKAAKK